MVRAAGGAATVRPGKSDGTFGAGIKETDAFAGHDLITAVGDLNGDGRNDLVARWTATGRLDAYLGRGDGGFRTSRLSTTGATTRCWSASGDVNGDGKADLLARDATGALWLHPGTGRGGFGDRVAGARRLEAVRRDHRRRRLQPATATPTCSSATPQSKYGFVLPANGDGSYGHPLGPVTRLKAVGGLLGAAQRPRRRHPRPGGSAAASGSWCSPTAARSRPARPIATGVDLSNANLVLNAGDWDRDGFGDLINRSKKTGMLVLRRGDGTGQFADHRQARRRASARSGCWPRSVT